MPRKNRQRLHREQRLRAEARKAADVVRRRERRARAVAQEAGVARVLRAAPVPRSGPARVASVWSTVEGLLRLADVSKSVRRRVRALYDVTGEHVPELCVVSALPLHLLLARRPWIRDPEDWAPPSGSWRRRRASLAMWLLARWKVPGFLLEALEVQPCSIARVPVEDEWAFALLAHLGQGGSLFAAVGTPVLPAPLTRRMCHAFVATPAGTDPVLALRLAQVAGFGGSPALAHALARTRLGRLQGGDPDVGEAWWHGVIGWLAARAPLRCDVLRDVVDWVHATRRLAVAEGRPFTLKGRTLDGVVAAAAAWQERQRALAPGDRLPSSGFVPLAFAAGGQSWSFHELGTARALVDEGVAMSNCVASYRAHVEKGKASIWSLRRDGSPCVTIEVALAAARVVQAKRSANRTIGDDERAAIVRWASANRLDVTC